MWSLKAGVKRVFAIACKDTENKHCSMANVHDMELMEGEESKGFQGKPGFTFAGLQFLWTSNVSIFLFPKFQSLASYSCTNHQTGSWNDALSIQNRARIREDQTRS